MTSILDYLNNVIWKLLKLIVLMFILVTSFQAMHEDSNKKETKMETKLETHLVTSNQKNDMASSLYRNSINNPEYFHWNAYFIGVYTRAMFACPGNVSKFQAEVIALKSNPKVSYYIESKNIEAAKWINQGYQAFNAGISEKGLNGECQFAIDTL